MRYDQQMFRKWRQSIRLPWNVINKSLHEKIVVARLVQKLLQVEQVLRTNRNLIFSIVAKGFATIRIVRTLLRAV